MSDWSVRLKGHPFDLEDLSAQLRSTAINITAEDGSFYLRSEEFDSLADATKIWLRAGELLERINGAAKIRSPGYQAVEADCVIHVDEAGRHQSAVFAAGTARARARMSAAAFVTSDGPIAGQDEHPSELNQWLGLLGSTSVDKALRMYGSRDASWDNLFKIYEVVEQDVGSRKIVEGGWASGHELERFSRTANSVDVVGDDARHGRRMGDPPKKPMSLGEAQALVNRILQGWLEQHSRLAS